jgi:hypothetical protein
MFAVKDAALVRALGTAREPEPPPREEVYGPRTADSDEAGRVFR